MVTFSWGQRSNCGCGCRLNLVACVKFCEQTFFFFSHIVQNRFFWGFHLLWCHHLMRGGGWGGGKCHPNDRCSDVCSVCAQGFWPEVEVVTLRRESTCSATAWRCSWGARAARQSPVVSLCSAGLSSLWPPPLLWIPSTPQEGAAAWTLRAQMCGPWRDSPVLFLPPPTLTTAQQRQQVWCFITDTPPSQETHESQISLTSLIMSAAAAEIGSGSSGVIGSFFWGGARAHRGFHEYCLIEKAKVGVGFGLWHEVPIEPQWIRSAGSYCLTRLLKTRDASLNLPEISRNFSLLSLTCAHVWLKD